MDQDIRTTTGAKIIFWILVFLVAIALSLRSQAQSSQKSKDSKDREYRFKGSKIEGEREKPKDLYILPWQGTQPPKEEDVTLNFLETTSPAHDRYTVQKEVEYFQKIK